MLSCHRVAAGALLSLIVAGSFAGRSLAQSLEEFDADYLESPAGGPDLDDAEQRVVRQTNELRQEQGLPPVEQDGKLQDAARYFAAYMARTQQYGHTADGNRPSQRASLFDYDYCVVSENIAFVVQPGEFSAAELGAHFYAGWRDSPEHRDNMLDPDVTETAVAIAFNPQGGGYYAVQMFGRPRSAAFHFRVVNRTEQTLSYAVEASSRRSGQPRTFELPPRATRTHVRCRPARLDWGWTDEDDNVAIRAQGGVSLVVSGGGNDLRVAQEPLSQPPSS